MKSKRYILDGKQFAGERSSYIATIDQDYSIETQLITYHMKV